MSKRKQPRTGTQVPGASAPQVVHAWVDYRQTPFGPWRAELRFADEPADVFPFDGPDAHETMHEVLDYLEAYTDRTGQGVATAHSLNGDTQAWFELAQQAGFVECVQSGSTSTHVIRP